MRRCGLKWTDFLSLSNSVLSFLHFFLRRREIRLQCSIKQVVSSKKNIRLIILPFHYFIQMKYENTWSHISSFYYYEHWAPCVADADIIFCPVVSSSSIFFPGISSAVGDSISAILPHMLWPECEFRTQVRNMLHVARWTYRMQRNRQKFAIWALSHSFAGLYLRN